MQIGPIALCERHLFIPRMGGGFSKKPDDELENVVPSPGPVKAGHGHYGEGHGDTGFRPEAMPGSPRYTLAGGKPVSDEVVLDRFGGNMYELLKNEEPVPYTFYVLALSSASSCKCV